MPLMKIRYDLIQQAIQGVDYIGYCLACGAEHDGIVPDGREYQCEACDEFQVYGAEEILMMDMVAMEGN